MIQNEDEDEDENEDEDASGVKADGWGDVAGGGMTRRQT
jgi:hypothetical protein